MILTGIRGVPRRLPPGGRATVLQGDFGSDYETALPWDFVNNSFNAGTMSEAFTTMNGFDAVAITWDAGALPGHRFGGRMDLPGAYAHAWFTYDVKLSDPFSPGTTLFGGKQPGFGNATAPSGCTAVNTCDGGWLTRRMWRGTKNSYSGSEKVPAEHYLYYPFKSSNCGDRFAFSSGFALGIPLTVEQEVQVNSAHNVADGFVRTSINGVLVGNVQGLRYYCDSESNRAGALIAKLYWLIFWGGATAEWSPFFASTLTFGAFKVEVPNA